MSRAKASASAASDAAQYPGLVLPVAVPPVVGLVLTCTREPYAWQDLRTKYTEQSAVNRYMHKDDMAMPAAPKRPMRT